MVLHYISYLTRCDIGIWGSDLLENGLQGDSSSCISLLQKDTDLKPHASEVKISLEKPLSLNSFVSITKHLDIYDEKRNSP